MVVASGFGGGAVFVFALAVFTAAASVIVAAGFFFGFGFEFGDGNFAALRVNSDEGEVGRGDVVVSAGDGVFDPDFDADFHGRGEGAVEGRFEDEQVADVDGRDEVDVVHRGGDDVGAGVAIGGHGSDEVDVMHEAAAEQVAEGVGVVGQDYFGHLRLRLGGPADGEGVAVQFHGWLAFNRVLLSVSISSLGIS